MNKNLAIFSMLLLLASGIQDEAKGNTNSTTGAPSINDTPTKTVDRLIANKVMNDKI